MQRLLRYFVRGVLALVVLCLAAALSGITGVDYRPFQEQPYYLSTVDGLAANVARNRLVTNSLSAGFGQARLTPTMNAAADNPERGEFRVIPLAGFGARHGRPATGVHDELWVKAVALAVGGRTGVVISADSLIIPRDIANAAATQLRHDTGLGRAQVYFSATHTHGSIGGWGEGKVGEAFSGKFNPAVRVWFAQQLAAAAKAALADMAPARTGHGEFNAPDLIRNRLVGDAGRIDPEFSLIVVQQEKGRMAVLGSYGAHATVLSASNMEFTADYPGAWQRAVEQATGGLAMFLAGGVGSHAPRPPASGFDGAQKMGAELAARTIKALSEISLTNRLTFGLLSVDVELPELHTRITDGLRLRPVVAKQLLPPMARRTFMQGLRLGDSLWFSMPCDFSGELALDFKAPVRAVGKHAVITSFNGDYIGYVIPFKYYHLDGYEPRTMSFYGPEVPDYLSDLLLGLAAGLEVDNLAVEVVPPAKP